MMRRVLGILAMLMACAALAVVAVHASPLGGPVGSGPIATPSVGSSLAGPDQSSQPSGQSAAPACGASQLAPNASQPQDGAQEPGEAVLTGCVASIDASQSTFTITTATGAVTVIVNPQTEYNDGFTSIGSLRTGMSVLVDAFPQSNGTAVATAVDGPNEPVDAPESSNSNSDAGASN